MKSKLDKLHVNKLKTVPINLKKNLNEVFVKDIKKKSKHNVDEQSLDKRTEDVDKKYLILVI